MLLQHPTHAPPSPHPEPPFPAESRVGVLRFSGVVSLQTAGTNEQCASQPILPFLHGGVNSTAYASALDSCSCPRFGQQVHAHLIKNGFHRREFVQTKLLQMYGKCGRVEHVRQVFDKMLERNLYTYAAILNALLDNGLFEEAFEYFGRLLFEDVELEFFVFPVALKICGGHGGVELGRQLHGVATKIGVLSHIYVRNALIDMYGKRGSLNDAEKVFDKMLEKDCVSWNSMVVACAANGRVFEALGFLEEMLGEDGMVPNVVSWSALIGGFAQKGYDEEAIEMLCKMRALEFEPNARILASVLAASASLKEVELGKEIYGYIVRHGFMSSTYVVNGLIDLYRRCGDIASAYKVFSKFSTRDVVSFNTMIAAYCDNGEFLKAKALFDTMESEGKTRDLISWNSMISGYVDNVMFKEALRMLTELMNKGGIEPNSFTLGSALVACADMGSLRMGKAIHSYCIVKGLQSNLFVGGALVDMYCHCQDLEAARKALGRVPDVYTWNSIIVGCVENGHHELALQLFSYMQASSLRPDVRTVGIVLPACSRLATLERGKQVHAYAVRHGFESDVYSRAALIDMYAKCGSMKYAKLVHSRTKNHNLVTLNAMLNAHAMHGQGQDGIFVFREMLVDGFKPDSVTFLALLSSCVHARSVDAGQEFFNLMGCYGVMPTLKHYTCMVDLLSRAGQLKQAHEMVERMPMDPDSVIWGALLGGCIIHGDVNLGEIAAHKLIELEPDNSGNYVMLANLYASTGKWHELGKIRQQMKEEELHKSPGGSWIEDKDDTHFFMASDRSHKRAQEIYGMLDNLTEHMRFKQS